MTVPARQVPFLHLHDPSAVLARDGILDAASPFRARRIGEILVSTGNLQRRDLRRILLKQANDPGPPLGALLVSEGLLTESELASGLALQRGVRQVRVTAAGLDTHLVDALGADFCLRHGIVPMGLDGRYRIVATARPERFAALKDRLIDALGPVRMAISDGAAIRAALVERRATWLVARAEARPPAHLSVRGASRLRLAAGLCLAAAAVLITATLAPRLTLLVLTGLVTAALLAMTGLRAAALIATLARRRNPPPADPALPSADLPAISILVPLLGEANITDHLIGHLSALDYPEDRLDILLVTEASDGETAAALGRSALPRRFHRVTVPGGRIRTKPRALNYALDFARGDIVGVYDAEDAPDPDQLRRIAATFAAAPDDVVCLQGILDFYNPAQNVLSRWFALDYAAWFRVLLPGLARLGFAIPLGGTTLFFRRDALEALGGWDAHNVTEDADLGIRLARRGWRTAMAETVTREEANCLALPWIRQRSRWLKGYALTWAVHMRSPAALWRDLGPRRFLGFQAMFLGTIFLFLGAPLLWTLWLVPFGIAHPLADMVAPGVAAASIAIYIVAEVVDLTAACVAVWRKGDRWLAPWAPGLMLYFPLATIACYKALAEAAIAPFFWDKTPHGLSSGTAKAPDRPPRSA